MSEDFFSAPNTERPESARDPREYPVPDEWSSGKQGQTSSPGVSHQRPPYFGGAVLIAIGVLFFLNNTGVVHIHSIWQYWPLILVGVGISKLRCSRGMAQLWALLVVSIGVLFLIQSLGLVSLSIGLLWPVGLIAAGFFLLLNRNGLRPGMTQSAAARSSQQSFDEREIHLFSFFSGVKRVLDTNDFRGGEALAIFGGVDVDLRLAGMSGAVKEVIIDSNAMFGGVNIKVPDNWRVAVRGIGIFGGYEDKTLRRRSDVDPNSPLLVITGYAIFGGIEVKS